MSTKEKYNWIKPSAIPYFYIPCPINKEKAPAVTIEFFEGTWFIKIMGTQKVKSVKGSILNDTEIKKLAVKEFKSYINKLKDIADGL